MELFEAMTSRTSVRAFKSDPVPRHILEKVIRAGIAAPSKGNSQIWEFFIVAGKKKKELADMLLDLLKTDLIPSMKLGDTGGGAKSPGMLRAECRSSRNREELSKVLSPLGLSVDDFMLEGTFTFFNAPVAVLVMVEREFADDLPHILSIGAAVQNMLLAAVDLGLGACWIGGVWRYTKQIRSLLGIGDGKRLLSSIALGYPDPASPIGLYRAGRDDPGEFTTWIGFDGDEPPAEGARRPDAPERR